MRRPVKNRKKPSPDTRHNSEKVGQFIGYVMKDGKRSIATDIIYTAFDRIKEETKEDPLVVFERALDNVGPVVEVRSRRVGGANYQVPVEIRPERRRALAMRWILDGARGKKGSAMGERLAVEIIAASKEEGEAFRKKQNMHAMADANKAFAHFAFTKRKKKQGVA